MFLHFLSSQPSIRYEFDTVFGPQSTQVQVFNELKPLVTSCMDGFSVTIFAYGQTGSGKVQCVPLIFSDFALSID